jgi:small subunit ribosomal protein S2e
MADVAPVRGGRGGFGARGRGGRGRGGRGRGGRGRGNEAREWVAVTQLGRLVQTGEVNSLDDDRFSSLPFKEPEIVDFLLGSALKTRVLDIIPVKIQTRYGERTRFKAFIGEL